MSDNRSGSYELTIMLGVAFNSVTEQLHRQLEQLGFDDVRPVHGYIFQRLAAKGATGVELAEHIGVTKQAASLMIDYLEQRGYVKRHPHPTDGRGKIVVLTERGWSCIRTTESIFAAIEGRWTELLGHERMERLRAEMRLIIGSSEQPPRLRPVW